MRLTKAHLFLLSFYCLGALAACHKSNGPLNSANVMFVNGCMNTSSVSVKANSVNVEGASAIPFSASSGYVYVNAGTAVNLTFFRDNTGTPLANRAENISAPNHYTAFAGGDVSDPKYVFTTDDLTLPATGKAKLRFINLSPDNINETATVNDSIVAQGVSLNNVSGFCQLRAGKYTIGAFDPTNSTLLINATDSLTFKAGKIYTVMLTGSAAGSGNAGLNFSVINNN